MATVTCRNYDNRYRIVYCIRDQHLKYAPSAKFRRKFLTASESWKYTSDLFPNKDFLCYLAWRASSYRVPSFLVANSEKGILAAIWTSTAFPQQRFLFHSAVTARQPVNFGVLEQSGEVENGPFFRSQISSAVMKYILRISARICILRYTSHVKVPLRPGIFLSWVCDDKNQTTNVH